jgi:alanine racemase
MSATVPPESTAGARLTVDLAALAANWRDLAARVAPAECGAAVKADAYGIGAARAVPALRAAGCRSFFVALPDEGAVVRAAAPDATVYVLNGFRPDWTAALLRHRIAPVLGSIAEIEAWAAVPGERPGAALAVDTGMNRLGLDLGEARAIAGRPELLAAAGIELLISHFACADEPAHPLNGIQAARFAEVRSRFPRLRASLANSAGLFLDRAHHLDLARPGIALYGGGIVSGEPSPMRPVVRLDATILAIRRAREGETVGYGATERLRRDSRLAILSTGYADGYRRGASSSDARPGGHGFLAGAAVPIVGRVSMDLMAVDVTDVPAARPGDTVELIGPNVPLAAVAAAMGTIDYEVLTSLGRRFARHYRD